MQPQERQKKTEKPRESYRHELRHPHRRCFILLTRNVSSFYGTCRSSISCYLPNGTFTKIDLSQDQDPTMW